MRLRHLLQATVFSAIVVFAGAAFGEEAHLFVHRQQDALTTLLKLPASADRDAKVSEELARTIDYDEMVRRAFGAHWAELNDDQKAECSGLMRKVIENAQRKNLIKTLDYDIAYNGERADNGDAKVKTEAKSRVNSREPPVRVDYLVRDDGSGHKKIVEIITEGSALTRNYGDQFHRMLTNEGYPYLVQKLRDKVRKGSTQ